MYLPEKYKKFSTTYPEIFEIYQELGKKPESPDRLTEKLKT